ncbi:MAG TPA: polysaccharide biosynthesis tyrosine autokinase [Acidimicrobiales bacterium]|nr:polysaccharide biosynthesis tyrosine autokinase [Acidimicrobiales bacterium]
MASPVDVQTLELRSHLRVLARHKRAIVLTTLLLLAASVVLSALQTPEYEGEIKVLIQRRQSESLFDSPGQEQSDPARRVSTEIQIAKSEPVRSVVRQRLGDVPRVKATAIEDADIIELKGRGRTAERAAEVTRAYAGAYLDFRRAQAVEDAKEAERKLQAKIDDLQAQVEALDERAASNDPGARATASATREQLVTQQALFKNRLDQLQVEAELETGGAQLVADAGVHTQQVKPRPVRYGAIAIAAGLTLGIGFAFLRESLDDSIKTKEELDRSLPGIPVLALVPAIEGWKNRSRAVLITAAEPLSPPAESYRTLRTALQFIGGERPPRIIEVASANAGEGKTSTVSNLAVVAARAGQKVIVADCDLRNPRLHEFYGLGNEVGFTSLYLGHATLESALRPVDGVDNLMVLPTGPLPPNPSELLSDKRTGKIMASLAERCDLLLIDCPPLLPVTDAAALSLWADAALFVVRAGATSKRDLQRAVEILLQADVPVIGTVLNSTAKEERAYYYYYRADREGHRPSAPGRRASRGRNQRSDPRLSRPDAPVGPAPGSNGAGEAQPSAADAAEHRR